MHFQFFRLMRWEGVESTLKTRVYTKSKKLILSVFTTQIT